MRARTAEPAAADALPGGAGDRGGPRPGAARHRAGCSGYRQRPLALGRGRSRVAGLAGWAGRDAGGRGAQHHCAPLDRARATSPALRRPRLPAQARRPPAQRRPPGVRTGVADARSTESTHPRSAVDGCRFCRARNRDRRTVVGLTGLGACVRVAAGRARGGVRGQGASGLTAWIRLSCTGDPRCGLPRGRNHLAGALRSRDAGRAVRTVRSSIGSRPSSSCRTRAGT